MFPISKSALTRMVTSERIKMVMSQLGCLVCDQHLVDMTKPNVKQIGDDESDPSLQFPVVWRDQVAGSIRLSSTPEGRSLTSV